MGLAGRLQLEAREPIRLPACFNIGDKFQLWRGVSQIG